MTLRTAYHQTKQRLTEAGLADAPAEAAILIQHFFGLSRTALILRGDEEAPSEAFNRLEAAVTQRIARRPLQYILGQWDFMGLTLSVGEGVLVPREDTAVLVEAVAGYLAGKSASNFPGKISEDMAKGIFSDTQAINALQSPQFLGADLCSGTGAVALAICAGNPQAAITAVELSDSAFGFLKENLSRHPQWHINPLQGDITDARLIDKFPAAGLDFIAANPPYIETQELPMLQPEVQKEPAMALDGGPDGLIFYRVLAHQWKSRLKPGGLLAVEIGETQGEAVKTLLAENGFTDTQIHKDMAGLDRAVLGLAPHFATAYSNKCMQT